MDANSNKIDDLFEKELINNKNNEKERLIIVFDREFSNDAVKILEDYGIDVGKEYHKAIHGISIDVEPDVAFEIPGLLDNVALVYKPRPVELHLDRSTRLIRVRDYVWNASSIGFKGD